VRQLILVGVLIATSSASGTAARRSRVHDISGAFTATAYCRRGETQSGAPAHRGVVAADPRLLPTGSRVRLHGIAGRPQTYVVEDHGVHGRRLDIFMPSCRAAKRFGKRPVHVHVVQRGDGQRLRSDGR
jgi:3D (Asp-Asp-Asp) domain-containing protein